MAAGSNGSGETRSTSSVVWVTVSSRKAAYAMNSSVTTRPATRSKSTVSVTPGPAESARAARLRRRRQASSPKRRSATRALAARIVKRKSSGDARSGRIQGELYADSERRGKRGGSRARAMRSTPRATTTRRPIATVAKA
jgi:hypothetical protein